jgi:hypothetical protein
MLKVFALLASSLAVWAQEPHYGAQARVSAPVALKDLFNNQFSSNIIPARAALFGKPEYGSKLVGALYYPFYSMNTDGCAPFDTTNEHLLPHWNELIGDEGNADHLRIMLLQRGDCYFVDKIRHAQAIGASAVLVADDRGGSFLPYMSADPTTSGDVNIPSMIISKTAGDILVNWFEESFQDSQNEHRNLTVGLISMSWDLPRPDGRVEWDFFDSTFDPSPEMLEFKKAMQEINDQLGHHALFTPRFHYIRGERTGCTISDDICGNQCLPGGHYCSEDPDNDLLHGYSGADVVKMNILHKCVYKWDSDHLDEEHKGQMYMSFQTKFIENCVEDDKGKTHFTQECAMQTLSSVRSDATSAVGTCFQSALDTSRESIPLVEDDLVLRGHLSIFPDRAQVAVNEIPLRETLACKRPLTVGTCDVMQAICNAFAPGTMPAACELHCPKFTLDGGKIHIDQRYQTSDGWAAPGASVTVECLDGFDPDGPMNMKCLPDSTWDSAKMPVCVSNARLSSVGASGLTKGATAVIVIVVLIVVFGGGFGIWYVMKKQNQSERRIDSILASYSPLESSGPDSTALMDGQVDSQA